MRRLARLALLVLLVAAAGCETGDESRSPAAEPAAKRGGAIAVAIAEPESIEPSTVSAFDPGGSLVVTTMCDRLVEPDPRTGELRPAIAESWQVAEGGRRITLRLRDGVRLASGRDLTAEDVAFSLSRVALPSTASPVAELLRPIDGFEELRGETTGGDEDLSELRGVEVIDNRGLEITLRERRADFVRVLAHPAATPIGKRETERDPAAAASRPVCAGPYRMAEPWKAGDASITLTRTPGYYARNAAYTRGGGGYADQIELRFLREPQSRLDAFRARAVGVADVADGQLPAARELGDDLVQAADPIVEYVALPVTMPPFDRREVRIALSQALDRRRIVETVWAGGRLPATGVLPPTVGRATYRDAACGNRAPADGDVARARRTLAEAGVELTGKPLKLYFNDEFENRALMAEVGEQWRTAFGAVPALEPMGWEPYLQRVGSQTGMDGPFRMGWGAQYPSADAYLGPLFDSSSIGRDNVTGFSSREFDRVLDKDARRAADAGERRRRYQALEDEVCAEMPAIPVAFGAMHHLVRKDRLGSAVGTYTDVTSGRVLLRELFLRGPAA